jgi:hypothetical protein
MNRTPEDLLVGLFALALVPLIAMRIRRGIREGRVPVYRTYLTREENRAKFNVLLLLHALSLVLIAAVAADLLLGLGFREAL